jgi:hypothetical protein
MFYSFIFKILFNINANYTDAKHTPVELAKQI